MEELLEKHNIDDDTRKKDTPTKILQSVRKKNTPTKISQSVIKNILLMILKVILKMILKMIKKSQILTNMV